MIHQGLIIIWGSLNAGLRIIPEKEVKEAICECNLSAEEVAEIEKNPVDYESAKETVNISIDDVSTKKQKEERGRKKEGDDKTGGRKYVHNTVAHVRKWDGKAISIASISIHKLNSQIETFFSELELLTNEYEVQAGEFEKSLKNENQ